MMKRNLIILLCAVVCISLGIALWLHHDVYGHVKNVRRISDVSQHYTEQEIHAAMDVAVTYFRSSFGGCELLEIRYDEGRSVRESTEWAEQYHADQAIVLFSSFDVKAKDAWKEGLTPGKTYKNWRWVLVRSGTGAWQLKTWGYG